MGNPGSATVLVSVLSDSWTYKYTNMSGSRGTHHNSKKNEKEQQQQANLKPKEKDKDKEKESTGMATLQEITSSI